MCFVFFVLSAPCTSVETDSDRGIQHWEASAGKSRGENEGTGQVIKKSDFVGAGPGGVVFNM